MKQDPFLGAFDEYAETLEASILATREELKAVRALNDQFAARLADVDAWKAATDTELTELRSALALHRSAPDEAELRGMIQEVVSAAGLRGPPGADGKDVEPELVERMVADAVAKVPPPKDGKDGTDGKDADPETIAEMVRDAVAKIPSPKDGADGKDADPALIERMVAEAVARVPPPKDGKDADPAEIEAVVAEAIKALPKPKDGAPGKDADPTVIERMIAEAVAKIPVPQDGKDAAPGERGADGVGIRGVRLKDGNLVIQLTDGTEQDVGRIAGPPGKDGEPGKDGRDGEDGLGSEAEIERAVEAATREAFAAHARSWYAGVYKAGESYRVGQGATWDGNLWIAARDTDAKPGTDDSWTLVIKRGRDGRDRR